MMTFMQPGAGNILMVKASGELTRADCHALLARLESVIQKRGKARLFLELEEFRGWETPSVWEGQDFALRVREDVKRVAVVGDEVARARLGNLADAFINLQCFTPEQGHEAWHWVTEGAREDVDREHIRRLAYTKWEAAGRPPGDGVRFWLEAEQELHQAS